MKRTLLSAAITVASFSVLYAQPTLTAATCNPVAGDMYIGHNVSTATLTPGAPGTSVTWNFGTLTQTGLDTTMFMTCAASPYCDSFSSSNLVGYDNADYTYFIASAAKLTAIGGHSDTSFIHFLDNKDIMRYPFTYNNTFKDSSAVNSMGLTITFRDVNTADGYGTLVLPSGTYTNVLRVHTSTVTTYLFSGVPVGGDSSETYSWYKPGYHSALMEMNYDTSGTGTGHVTGARYYTGPAYTTGINDANIVANAMQIFPNPATDAVHIAFNLADATDAAITISDLTGRTVAIINSNELKKGANDISYNTTNLLAGMYIIQLHSAEGSTIQRFIVNK